MDIYFSFKEIISAFMVLFAVIDILGAIPIIISLREKNQKIEAGKAAIISFVILVAFCLSGRHYWDYSMSIFLLLPLPVLWCCWF